MDKTETPAGVGSNDLLGKLHWEEEQYCDEEDTLFTVRLGELGRITVLDRMTGFDWGRDIESGYKDCNGKFWLASGHCDVREVAGITVAEAIEWIKARANTCVAA